MSFRPAAMDIPKRVLRAKIEVLYEGVQFAVGSDIRWMIANHRFSIFTDDPKLAEALDFRRIDRFEYEKTISIDDIETAYVTLYAENAERTAMTPEQFREWLCSYRSISACPCFTGIC